MVNLFKIESNFWGEIEKWITIKESACERQLGTEAHLIWEIN
jgi:hypothetical protein